MEFELTGEIWYWRGPSPYHFVTVPDELSEIIREVAAELTYGWGMIPARVKIGATEWSTSLFPQKGHAAYVLPVKDAARRAEQLTVGDTVDVRLVVGADRA